MDDVNCEYRFPVFSPEIRRWGLRARVLTGRSGAACPHRAVERPLAELRSPCPLATRASAELPHAFLTVESVLDPNFIFTLRRVKVKDRKRKGALGLFFYAQPVHRICWTACGILAPPQGSGLGPLFWEPGVLATQPPGNPVLLFKMIVQEDAQRVTLCQVVNACHALEQEHKTSF